jgi:hypothetical protein
MTGKISKIAMLALLVFSSFSFDVPKGWLKAGSAPDKYDMGIEFGSGRTSANAATIQSLPYHVNGFGTLMQNISPDKYRGKRIKLSGYMKSADVHRWAGFWLRVDQQNSTVPLSFDNMHDRAVSGTTNWRKYEIVLDVPENASNIAFGALLSGTGKIWFDDLKIEEVSSFVPTTTKGRKMQHDEPQNMAFED